MEDQASISFPSDKLIEFVNFINECCEVMDHDQVRDWIMLPHGFLNNATPLNEFLHAGPEKIYRLLILSKRMKRI